MSGIPTGSEIISFDLYPCQFNIGTSYLFQRLYLHIPLMIKAPDAVAPGRIVPDLVSHVDAAQYILEKVGVDGADLDGIFLAPVVENDAKHTRVYAFAEEGTSGLRPESDLIAMIRSETYKLIHFVGSENGQLLDLVTDPKETRNLWNKPEHKDI